MRVLASALVLLVTSGAGAPETVREHLERAASRVAKTRVALLALVLAACGAKSGLEAPRARLDAGPDARAFDAPLPSDADVGPLDVPDRDAEGTPGSDAPRDAPECAERRLALGETPPAVMIIVDRSGSMTRVFRMATTSYPDPASRFDIVLENLVGPPRGLVGTFGDRVRFGAMTFSATATCPDLRWVLPALNNRDAILDVLVAAPITGGTPIAETIREAVALLASEPEGPGGRPILVLATDGEPTGCRLGGSDTYVEVRRAFDVGHRTLVVSVADEVGEAFVADVADLGAGMPLGSGTPYFAGTNWVDLGAALDGAIGSAINCRAELPADGVDVRCDALPISLDGAPLSCDAPNGFRLAGRSTIELLGSACERARRRFPPARLVLGSLCDP